LNMAKVVQRRLVEFLGEEVQGVMRVVSVAVGEAVLSEEKEDKLGNVVGRFWELYG